MKKVILILIVFCSGKLLGQDLIYFDNNTKWEVNILDKNDSLLICRKANNKEGPLYSVRKTEITLIVYSNGEHEVIKKAEQKRYNDPVKYFIDEYWRKRDSITNARIKASTQKLDVYTQNPNILFNNLTEYINIGIGIDYVRELFKQKALLISSLAITAGTMRTEDGNLYRNGGNIENVYARSRPFSFNLGLSFNLGKRKFVTLNAGPMLRVAQYNGTFDHVVYTKTGYDTVYKYDIIRKDLYPKSFVMNSYMGQINATLLFRIARRINFMMYVNMTVFQYCKFISNDPSAYQKPSYKKLEYYNIGYPFTFTNIGLSIGYRVKFKVPNKQSHD